MTVVIRNAPVAVTGTRKRVEVMSWKVFQSVLFVARVIFLVLNMDVWALHRMVQNRAKSHTSLAPRTDTQRSTLFPEKSDFTENLASDAAPQTRIVRARNDSFDGDAVANPVMCASDSRLTLQQQDGDFINFDWVVEDLTTKSMPIFDDIGPAKLEASSAEPEWTQFQMPPQQLRVQQQPMMPQWSRGQLPQQPRQSPAGQPAQTGARYGGYGRYANSGADHLQQAPVPAAVTQAFSAALAQMHKTEPSYNGAAGPAHQHSYQEHEHDHSHSYVPRMEPHHEAQGHAHTHTHGRQHSVPTLNPHVLRRPSSAVHHARSAVPYEVQSRKTPLHQMGGDFGLGNYGPAITSLPELTPEYAAEQNFSFSLEGSAADPTWNFGENIDLSPEELEAFSDEAISPAGPGEVLDSFAPLEQVVPLLSGEEADIPYMFDSASFDVPSATASTGVELDNSHPLYPPTGAEERVLNGRPMHPAEAHSPVSQHSGVSMPADSQKILAADDSPSFVHTGYPVFYTPPGSYNSESLSPAMGSPGFPVAVSVSPELKAREGVERFACPHCDADFRIKGYLTRHIKKHAENKAYQCPFLDHSRDKNSKDSRCHPTGGFSRRDTYKTHLKSRHFIYPASTPCNERNNVAGQCAACKATFSNNEEWVEQHIQTRKCPALKKPTVH